ERGDGDPGAARGRALRPARHEPRDRGPRGAAGAHGDRCRYRRGAGVPHRQARTLTERIRMAPDGRPLERDLVALLGEDALRRGTEAEPYLHDSTEMQGLAGRADAVVAPASAEQV